MRTSLVRISLLTLSTVLVVAAVGVFSFAPAQQRGPVNTTPPAGITPLPIDLFTTKNFYLDRQLWTDKRYTRCNTPHQLTDQWPDGTVGQWGNCDNDIPVSQIVSPYKYAT